MQLWGVGIVGAILLVARAGVAQTEAGGVTEAPSTPAPVVAAPHEPQELPAPPEPPPDIQVGDVILAPPLEQPEVAAKREAVAQRPKRRWYGAPILIGDAVSYTLVLMAVGIDHSDAAPGVAIAGTLGYALVGPITHLSRGNWGRAGLSVLTRATLPIAGAIAGGGAGCNTGQGDNDDCAEALVTGFALGLLGATAVDAALLASEPVSRTQPRASIQPVLSAGADHAFVGAAGRF